MSRSLSLAIAGAPSALPATNACAITTERVSRRPCRSACTRRIASVRVASWVRAGSAQASRTESGSR